MPSLDIHSFTGQTDNYIDGPKQAGKSVLNFYVDDNDKLVQRGGFVAFHTTAGQEQGPGGNAALHSMYRLERTQSSDSLITPNEEYNFLMISSGYTIYTSTGRSDSWRTVGTVLENGSVPSITYPMMISRNTVDRYIVSRRDSETYILKYSYLFDVGITYPTDWIVYRAGLPTPNSGSFPAPTVTASNDDSKNYFYYFVFVRSDQSGYHGPAGTRIYGKPYILEKTNMADPSIAGHYMNAANMDKCDGTGPNITAAKGYYIFNGVSSNHGVFVRIYRTTHNGSIPYYVGQVTYTATTFKDEVTDAVLVTRSPLYTASGEVDHDQPPGSLFSTYVAYTDTTWYVCNSIYYQYGSYVLQSIPGLPEATPSTFRFEAEIEIKGCGTAGRYPVFFENECIYRVEGTVDNIGNGAHQKMFLSRTEGVISHRSIVQVDTSLYFLSRTGTIFVTDGFQLIPLSEHVGTTIQTMLVGIVDDTDRDDVAGTYDAYNNRIYWVVPGATNGVICLDLNKPIGANSCITFMDYSTDTTALTYYQPDDTHAGYYVRAQTNGYVFMESAAALTDPVVDTTKTYANWYHKAVVPEWESCAFSFGGSFNRKWITKMHAIFENLSDLTAQFFHKNDLEDSFTEAGKTIVTQSGTNKVWKRLVRMTRGKLRCYYKQIKITKGKVIVAKSDDYEVATTNGAANTVVITGTWPTGIEGMFVSLDDDSYVEEWEIYTRSATTLVVLDAGNTLPTGAGKQWVIRGYPKDQKMRILGVSIPFLPHGEGTFDHSTTGDGSGNA